MNNVISVICLSVVGLGTTSTKNWTEDYAVALSSARQAKRPMLVVLEDPESGQLRADQLFDVEAKLLHHFELCRVDATSDYGRKVADLYGVSQLPYTVITDNACRRILFRGSGQFSARAWQTTLVSFSDVKSNDTNAAVDADAGEYQVAATNGAANKGAANKGAADKRAEDSVAVDVAAADMVKDAEMASLDDDRGTDAELEKLELAFSHAVLNDALEAGRSASRPVVVVVSMDNCHYCDKLTDEVLSDAQVRSLISQRFESVIIKEADYVGWVSEQNVKIFPTTLVFEATGGLADRIEGYVPADELASRLRNAGAQLLSLVP